MTALVRCDECNKMKPEGDHTYRHWVLLWQRDLHFCSWKCLADYATREAQSITTNDIERREA